MHNLTLKLYLILRALREEHGQDLIEYTLVGGIVGIGAIAGMGNLAANVNAAFGLIAGHLSTSVT